MAHDGTRREESNVVPGARIPNGTSQISGLQLWAGGPRVSLEIVAFEPSRGFSEPLIIVHDLSNEEPRWLNRAAAVPLHSRDLCT